MSRASAAQRRLPFGGAPASFLDPLVPPRTLLFCFAMNGYGWGLVLVTSILKDIGYGQKEADQIMMIASLGSLSALVFSPIAGSCPAVSPRWSAMRETGRTSTVGGGG